MNGRGEERAEGGEKVGRSGEIKRTAGGREGTIHNIIHTTSTIQITPRKH